MKAGSAVVMKGGVLVHGIPGHPRDAEGARVCTFLNCTVKNANLVPERVLLKPSGPGAAESQTRQDPGFTCSDIY